MKTGYTLALRWVITLHALGAFGQAVLAGRFLSGDYDMVAAHATNATVVGGIGYLQVVVALLVWRPGRGPVWPLAVSVGLVLAETAQILLGYFRGIGVHVPLGVAIIAALMVLLTWAWRRSAA
ncbi:hypothetical protein [Nocardia arthritidis]|uniref:Uncharacterized protein n=1 Tax=Nocardia arthritidis TaxID=228602 RepID=A0A6G9YQU1_9NOCA|nr:hypothetical protein [Nocardia arthritidis]QIS15675.1 hypothetical protein F5544_39275 [Nocardia arthritidis]